MFGGTAATYSRWQMDGEPFKEGSVFYVYVINPRTKLRKKVRFYADKKHADLMPQAADRAPLGEAFGFKDGKGSIIAIREKDLSKEEVIKYFSFNWKMGMFFGGIWYAPEGTELPPIKRANKFFHPTWEEFRAAGRAYAEEIGRTEGCWFDEEAK